MKYEENKLRLESLEKIRKLPKLKDGFGYEVLWDGSVTIFDFENKERIVLYGGFDSFVEDKIFVEEEADRFEKCLYKPLIEEVEVEEEEIVIKKVIKKKIIGYE